MYRPSMYNKHDESMNKFADLFNGSSVHKNIEMRPNPVETFDNDGIFIDVNTNRTIGYDWEYRDRYFKYCKLAFESLGQYERKLIKPSIQLSIQCDSTETGIAVGWHEDWLCENKERKALRTDFSKKENGSTRYTTNFRIYKYEEINQFKEMIERAIRLRQYNSRVFAMLGGNKTSSGAGDPIQSYTVRNSEDNAPQISLAKYFTNHGLTVVDKRQQGGCLWVLGSETEIGKIIRDACGLFHVGGQYGAGKATGYKPGWFTKAKK